ncbi:hypothetical protein A1O1_00653 [Capronia coronata CBS 617.96]|uniref:Uncharacterized protein n=1 Tax=Capronia coronata CBS 617.96 TaxID=1182541 RepID=W9Z1T0_9EURO|nr:uncharacterized protein A1O1_00653 [Capronia coronata CBS 617.96]EXJ95531.1 hypothetical protein A1O1_00653 [Capronia coronata CBS 617.96]
MSYDPNDVEHIELDDFICDKYSKPGELGNKRKYKHIKPSDFIGNKHKLKYIKSGGFIGDNHKHIEPGKLSNEHKHIRSGRLINNHSHFRSDKLSNHHKYIKSGDFINDQHKHRYIKPSELNNKHKHVRFSDLIGDKHNLQYIKPGKLGNEHKHRYIELSNKRNSKHIKPSGFTGGKHNHKHKHVKLHHSHDIYHLVHKYLLANKLSGGYHNYSNYIIDYQYHNISCGDEHHCSTPMQCIGGFLFSPRCGLQAFANSFIGQDNVRSVGYGDNTAYGFSLTTSELEDSLGLLGSLNSLCAATGIFELQISDTTCAATALPTQQCDVDVSFCALQSFDTAGITTGTCTYGVLSLPCALTSQVESKALSDCQALDSACQAYGNYLLTPLTASQSVAEIQESIAAYALDNTCLISSTVTLSDASCS